MQVRHQVHQEVELHMEQVPIWLILEALVVQQDKKPAMVQEQELKEKMLDSDRPSNLMIEEAMVEIPDIAQHQEQEQ